MKWFGQLVHASELINAQENTEDHFKHIKHRLEMTCWSAPVRTGYN